MKGYIPLLLVMLVLIAGCTTQQDTTDSSESRQVSTEISEIDDFEGDLDTEDLTEFEKDLENFEI